MTSYEPQASFRSDPQGQRKRIIRTRKLKKTTVKEVETPTGTVIIEVSSVRTRRTEKTITQRGERPTEQQYSQEGPATPRVIAPGNSAPQQWKLALRDVVQIDGRSADELNGDYFLDQLYADAGAVRWEHTFPAQYRLFRAFLDMSVQADGMFLQAGLAGLSDGPKWSGIVQAADQPTLLRFDRDTSLSSAELIWPEQIMLFPIES